MAVSAAPTNSDVLGSSPSSSIAPKPRTSGATTPTVAVASDALPTAPSSRRSISMPDLEQQQDHAELAERAQHLVAVADQAEHRGADEDAGEDLADDGRHAHPLGALGGQLRGHEDDEDVEEDAA